MYAHQVIESIQAWPQLRAAFLGGSNYWEAIVSKIKSSIKFSLGNSAEIERSSKTTIGQPLFSGDTGGVRLPYKNMWLDYNRYGLHDKPGLYKETPWRKDQEISRKRAILVLGLCDDVFMAYVFNFFNNEQRWDVSGVATIVFIDKTFGEHNLKKDILSWLKRTHFDAPIPDYAQTIPVPLYEMGTESIKRYSMENIDELSTLNQTLLLLSCKNIGTETVEPSVKLNRKRVKKGKQPLFTYKTLVVKPTGKKQKSIPKHLWENRVHLQRGHFKIYTEDKPLFGKLTGRYWWQPHVRGRNTDGIVMKDYLVTESSNHEHNLVANRKP